MKRFFIVNSSIIVLAVAVICCSYTNKNIIGEVVNSNEQKCKTNVNASDVKPNPKSGVLNLACCDGLQSPLTVNIINANGTTIKSNKSLVAEGAPSHKFIQIITTEIPAGKYHIIIKDAHGKEAERVVYLHK